MRIVELKIDFEFQSLIHQGKIARTDKTGFIVLCSGDCFNPLFIREKLQDNNLFNGHGHGYVLVFQSLIHQGKIARNIC